MIKRLGYHIFFLENYDDDDRDNDHEDDKCDADDETCRLPQPSVIRKAACSPFNPGTKAPKWLKGPI